MDHPTLPDLATLLLAKSIGTLGFSLAGAWYAKHALHAGAGGEGKAPSDVGVALVIGLGWALGLGAQGLIASWCYYLGLSQFPAVLVCGVAGGLLAWTLRGQWGATLSINLSRVCSWPNVLGLTLLIGALSPHLLRVILPWYDQDEITVYGYLSKLIAQGWTFPEVVAIWTGCVHFGPKLGECLDGQAYMLANDIWAIRLGRVFGLAAIGAICSGMLRSFRAPSLYGWAAAACALLTPELTAYLGVSLKVDAVVMLFEFSALCALTIAWIRYLAIGRGSGSPKNPRDQETVLSPAELACVLALFAAATRQSGLYAALLCGASFVWFSWPRPWALSALPLRRVTLLAALAGVAGIGYWANWAAFGNPIYPFKAPWPFSAAPFLTSLANYSKNLNIQGPLGIVQLYLIPHLALGLEMRNLPFPPHTPFPHALLRGQSMGWLNPTLLTVFLWPFAVSLRPALVLGAIFLWQFLIWSLGVQYSRVFIGSSLLMPLLCGYLCWARFPTATRWSALVQKLAFLLLTLTICLLLPLGLRWTWLRIGPAPQTIMTAAGRFEYNASVMSKFSQGMAMPTQADAAAFDEILATLPRPVVGVMSLAGNGVHTLFKQGFFVDGTLAGEHDAVLLGPDNPAANAPAGMRLARTSADKEWRLYISESASSSTRRPAE